MVLLKRHSRFESCDTMANTEWGGSVVLGNLDDFIAPSQACVNPIFTQSKNPQGNAANVPQQRRPGVAQITIESDDLFAGPATMKPDLIKSSLNNTAQVSLSDCLACSGCVTSAETVLVQSQSTEKFLQDLKSPQFKVRIVSVSPASHASLSVGLGLSHTGTTRLLQSFFQRHGVQCILDGTGAHNVALAEACQEFMRRYRFNHSQAPKVDTVNNRTNYKSVENTMARQPVNAQVPDRKKSRGGGRRSLKVVNASKKYGRIEWNRPDVTVARSATEIVDTLGNRVNLKGTSYRYVRENVKS